jgi:hypothetical protein
MPPGGFIPDYCPTIRVFRPGYIVAASANVDIDRSAGGAAPSVIRIRLDGTDVRLLPQDGDRSAYVEKLKDLYRWLSTLKGWGDPPKGSADEATRAVMTELIEVAPDYAEAHSMKEQLGAEGLPPLTGVKR